MSFCTISEEALPSSESVKSFFDSLTLSKILPPVLILIVGLGVIKFLMRFFDKVLARSKLQKTAHTMVRASMRVLLYTILILIIASKLGVDVSSLVAILSIISLALSLAVQGALTNIIGGITLLTTNPFKAGDYVQIGTTGGTVQEVGLNYTKLLTPDSKIISIPNSIASAAEITNYTSAGTRRVEVAIALSYEADPETVISALLCAAQDPTTLKDPAPFAGIEAYGDAKITYVLRFWTTTDDYWPAYYRANEAVAKELKELGTNLAHPHINVYMDK